MDTNSAVTGEKIKKLRKDRKLTQKQMADELFVSQQAISKYENGEMSVSIDFCAKVAKYFNVSLDYLADVEIIRDEDGIKKLTYMYQLATEQKKKLILKIVEDIVKSDDLRE